MKTKTVPVAIGSLFGGPESPMKWNDWRENDADYIRTSDIVEVEFPLIPDEVVIPAKIAALDDRIENTRAEMLAKIDLLETAKAKLLAIEHNPNDE